MTTLEKIFLILLLLFVAAWGILISEFVQLSKEKELEQSTIDHLRKENVKERDSLENSLSLTRDSLSIALHTIAVAHQQSVEAHARSQKTIDNLKKIIFITHTDSSRINELKTLYPSWR